MIVDNRRNFCYTKGSKTLTAHGDAMENVVAGLCVLSIIAVLGGWIAVMLYGVRGLIDMARNLLNKK